MLGRSIRWVPGATDQRFLRWSVRSPRDGNEAQDTPIIAEPLIGGTVDATPPHSARRAAQSTIDNGTDPEQTTSAAPRSGAAGATNPGPKENV